ncbi:MAG: hypothetical protein QOJ67_1338 [Acidimicrobiaceae bacterium]
MKAAVYYETGKPDVFRYEESAGARDRSPDQCSMWSVRASANASEGWSPAVAAIQQVIGAAVRSDMCAATPPSSSSDSISASAGGATPAAAANASSHSSRVNVCLPRVAGTSLGANVADIEQLFALAADHDGVHVVPAGRVVQHKRGALWTDEPTLAPRGHGGEDRVRIASLLREAVVEPRRVVLVLHLVEQAFVDEAGEPLREDVAADAKRNLEVVEAAGPETGLADEEEVPVIPEHVDAARHRAWPR